MLSMWMMFMMNRVHVSSLLRVLYYMKEASPTKYIIQLGYIFE